ncbi:ATP-dependent DNA helicase [Halocatena marina]|nr:ATP-dependent DNA helicase [Halocatena marina]
METIGEALSGGRDVLFEGACGTGKTLAALVPALEYAREANKTVVITTNVHQQTRQFIEEARAITRQESIQAVVFKGKLDMCHIDVGYEECQALRDTTRELAETEQERAELAETERTLLDESRAREGANADQAAEGRNAVMEELDELDDTLEELQEQATCEYYYRNVTEETDAFYEWLFADVRTPEEIYEYAHNAGLCGYELLKEGMEGVDLVVCNYHHVLDPMIREQFFRWLGRDPEDVVVVFDEAHNIEDAARDHATRTLTESTLESALSELESVEDRRTTSAENVIEAFYTALTSTYDDALAFGERETIGDEWYDLSITNETGRDELTLSFLDAYTGAGIHNDLDRSLDLGNSLDRSYQQEYKNGETRTRKECRILQSASFIDDWLRDSDHNEMYPVVSVRRDGGNDSVYGRSELYTCIPRQVTEPLFEELHASVLMSATLRPFDVLSDVLGITGYVGDDDEQDGPVTMAYGAQFPEERRRTYAVDTPALFASRREEHDIQRKITGVLEDAIEFTPGNVLCFFPSYREAERYQALIDVDATLYLDEPGASVEERKREFTGSSNGVFFTSLWGTLTEGVSFDGDDARTVVVVGVPYPRLDDRMEAVQSAYSMAFDGNDNDSDDPGWEYAVEVPTVRKTRQALGRVVRSPEDFGARLLVDERYTMRARREMQKYSVVETFPPEERTETIDIEPEKLRFGLLNFYTDMDAWVGAPPTP